MLCFSALSLSLPSIIQPMHFDHHQQETTSEVDTETQSFESTHSSRSWLTNPMNTWYARVGLILHLFTGLTNETIYSISGYSLALPRLASLENVTPPELVKGVCPRCAGNLSFLVPFSRKEINVCFVGASGYRRALEA